MQHENLTSDDIERITMARQRVRLTHRIAAVSASLVALAFGALLKFSGPVQHETGTEDFGTKIPFSEIPEKGDPRIKRVVSLLRDSKEGAKLYQYLSANGFSFQWQDHVKNKGEYENKLMSAVPHLSDEEIVYVIAHEGAHGWQDHTLEAKYLKKDPQTAWEAHRLTEVGACAYAARFAAAYKDEKQRDLQIHATDAYGILAALSYSATPPAQRNYYLHAIKPCFFEINFSSNYKIKHYEAAYGEYAMALEIAPTLVKMIDLKLQLFKYTGEAYEPIDQITILNSPDKREKAEKLAGLMTPFMDKGQRPAEIDPAKTDEFLMMVDRETLSALPEIGTMIRGWQKDFNQTAQQVKTLEAEVLAVTRSLQPRPPGP